MSRDSHFFGKFFAKKLLQENTLFDNNSSKILVKFANFSQKWIYTENLQYTHKICIVQLEEILKKSWC